MAIDERTYQCLLLEAELLGRCPGPWRDYCGYVNNDASLDCIHERDMWLTCSSHACPCCAAVAKRYGLNPKP